MSRARVTQVLNLLNLAAEVLGVLAVFGDPLTNPRVTERNLRPLLALPVDEQAGAFERMLERITVIRSEAKRVS